MNENGSKTLEFASSLIGFGLLILVWHLIAQFGLVSRVFLPSPGRTLLAIWNGLAGGELLQQWLSTSVRLLIGWGGASAAGVLLGALIGSSATTQRYVSPMLEFLRPLPASAVVPLAVAVLGLTNEMVIAVVSFGALWPMLLSTSHGFASVNIRLREVSHLLELGRLEFALAIALPSALPDILAGMRFGISVALILTIVGEMIASQYGLGSAILLASRTFQAPHMFAGIVLLGATGYLSSALLTVAERRLLRWY